MKTETDKERADRLERKCHQIGQAWLRDIDKLYSAYSLCGWLIALCFLSYLLGSAQMFFMNY